jgi:hypothetical protein
MSCNLSPEIVKSLALGGTKNYIYVSVIYLATLSVAKTISMMSNDRMVNEFGMICKEVVVA